MSRLHARRATALLACLASLVLTTNALAAQYPPGPGNCCPDTLTIIPIQDPSATPHLSAGDVVMGVGGVITGIVSQHQPYGIYIQMRNGLQYSGIPVYTGKNDHGPGSDQDLQIGDSVVVYGKIKSYKQATAIGDLGGNLEISALTIGSTNSSEDVTIRVVSHGNALPPTHVGAIADLERTGTNPAGRPWQGMLVRVNGPLQVVQIVDNILSGVTTLNGTTAHDRGFLAKVPSCTGLGCDMVLVDCNTLGDVPLPQVGTVLSFVQGVFDRREQDHIIQVRSLNDLGQGDAPLASDAFAVYDNDLPGSQRIDSLMVVFDRPVDKTTAENVVNYALGSNGAIDGAQRLDAPQDNRVVLKIRNGMDDGGAESITVQNVKSLSDGTAMSAPQTLDFLNGVIELEKVRTPDAGALSGNPCDDRSRYSGAGAADGPRASFTGTVTGKFGDYYTLQSTTPTRGGLWVYAPGVALLPGHGVLLVGKFHEVDGETQGTGLVYMRDYGSAAVPVAAVQSVGVLLDESCDATQLFLTGLDLDGMLVTVDRVAVTGNQLPGSPSFFVNTPGGAAAAAMIARARPAMAQSVPGGILVAELGGNFSTTPQDGRIVTVTGVLGRVNGAFAIFPVAGGDIHDFGPLPTFSLPLNVSKSATLSRDPDIVLGHGGELFMSWGRVFHESVHSLSQDDAENWSIPGSILHQGIQPALAVTPSNKFGVLTATPQELLFKQSTDGGFQMDALVTTVDGNNTNYPALTVGSGEHFHAAWERQGSGIFYSRSLDGGASFGTPLQIAGNTPPATNSMARIGATTGDNVFVFWQYHEPGEPGIDKVLYSRSLDAGTSFSAPRLLRDETNPLTSVIKLGILGDAQVAADGSVYVMGIQQGGPDDSVAFLRSTNNGLTFKLVGHVTAPAQTGVCVKSFCFGPSGQVHALVGICGTALFYTRSEDGGATWGPAVDVTSARSPSVGEPRGAKIILDENGTPIIVWFSQVGGSTEIFSSKLLN